MFFRFSKVAMTLLVSSALLQSCSNNFSFSQPAQGKAKSLASVFDENSASPAQLGSALRDYLADSGLTDQQKADASYVLGRIQQQNITSGALTDDNREKLNNTMRLFDDASQNPALAERAAIHIVEIASSISDEERARTALEYLRRKSTSAEVRAKYTYQIAQSEMRSQDYAKAQPLFEELKKTFASTEFAKAANYYLALCELTSGASSAESQQKAAVLLRQYIHGSPDGKFVSDAMTKFNDLARAGAIDVTDADHNAFGSAYFAQGSYSAALAEWAHAKPGAHGVKQAICYARTGKPELAQQTLLQAIKAQPAVSYEATAALISGPLSRNDTKAFWQDILNAHPAKDDDPLWNIALRSQPAEAIPLYKRILQKYPTSEYSPECVWWIFWDLAKQSKSDPNKATAALAWAKQGLEKYPTSKAAARLGFWSGKLQEQLKHTEEAKVAYQFSATHFPSYYYGHRAKARLRRLSTAAAASNTVADPATDPGWSTKPARVPPNLKWHWPTPQELVPTEQMDKRYGATITTLIKLRQYDEAASLLPDGAGPEFKASLLACGKKPLQAINAANLHLNGLPKLSERWEMAYPLEYADWISDNAKVNGVDPLLVHALIREESRYNPDALSRVKALGLMQLMPGTAYGVAKRLSVPLSGTQEVLKPEINIKLGTNYLAYTLKRFDNNALLAVASYNGGPNAVQSWFQQHKLAGNSDFDIFVENIPFRETRDYVRKVFGSYWTYEEIYAGKNI